MFSIEQLSQLLQQHYDIEGINDAQLKPLPSYCDQNALLICGDNRYIVKIAHPEEPLIALQMQNAMMSHLTAKAQQVPDVLNNNHGEQITRLTQKSNKKLNIRRLYIYACSVICPAVFMPMLPVIQALCIVI